MIFRTEHNFVYYLWNGTFAIMIHLPNGINPNAYYWMGNPSDEVGAAESGLLDKFAHPKNRTKIMKLQTRPGLRYVIVERGVFKEE